MVAPGSQRAARRARGRRAGVRDRARRRARRAAQPAAASTPGATTAAACRAARRAPRCAAHHPTSCSVGDVLVFEEVREPDDLRRRGRRPRASLGGAAHRGDAGERSVRAAVRRAAGRRPRSTSPRSTGTPPMRCRSRCASRSTERPGLEISVALGNIVLADHGQTVRDEALGAVPAADACSSRRAGCRRASLRQAARRADAAALPAGARRGAADARLRPRGDLLAVPISDDEAWWPASALLVIDPRDATAAASPTLTGTLGSGRRALDAAARPARQRRRRDRLRRRGRERRPRAAALRRRRARQAARSPAPRSPRPTASATAPPATSAPRRSRMSSARRTACSTASRNPMPAAGGVEPEDIEAARRDAPQAFRTQERAVTAGRLRRGRRAPPRRAARGGDLPLDRQLAHGVRHAPTASAAARSTRRSRRGCAATSSASAWPATTSRSTRRASCRSTSRCTSACRPDYFRSDVLQRGARGAVERRAARRPARRSSIRTTSSFGQPVYLSRIVAAAQAVEGVEAVRARTLPAPGRARARRRSRTA